MNLTEFAKFGGVVDHDNAMMAFAPAETPTGEIGSPVVNFGVREPNIQVFNAIASKLSLYDQFPGLRGKWDRRSRVNHWAASSKVLGESKVEELVQKQPRGTCGGRSGSLAVDLLQCVMIAAGKRLHFQRASHAFLYWQARKKYGMDKGNPTNERGDGVASGSIPDVLADVGANCRTENNDVKWYGDGSDDLAVQWGCGQIDPALASSLVSLASDNVMKAWAPLANAEEAADALAGGGIVIGADMQGFTMNRDSQGFCKPSGVWAHYHVRSGVANVDGRLGFEYGQSWGVSTPGGPRIEGVPGNVFRVDWDVQDACIRKGHYAAIFAFDPFSAEEEMDWIF